SASRYAEGRAEMQADVARHYGIPVEVRRVEEPSPIDKRAKLGRWEVHVGLETDLELEVLRRKPGPTLREWIRLCWKRQVNPRVFNPFLPVGLEERLGLDYYGNERPGGPSHGGT
ncbi:MAG TPA: hypothetical protein VEA38_20255, partial [Terriglobales bacterium]|nr:hypothetical protein [Terriglobales bacterium]